MSSKLVLNFQTSKKRCRDRKAPAQVTKMGGVIKVLIWKSRMRSKKGHVPNFSRAGLQLYCVDWKMG